MINIETMYADFLTKKQVENREKYKKAEGQWSASSAGQCFKKQMLRNEGVSEPILDDRVMRLLRLGTVMHTDIEESLSQYMSDPNSKYQTDEAIIFIEHSVTLSEFNVVGHLDIGIVQGNNIKVWDLKTCASYKWRMKFGRKPDPKGNPGYNLQLATYLYGLTQEQMSAEDAYEGKHWNREMALLWYNKDTSAMREEFVSNDWIKRALSYWEDLNDAAESTSEALTPGMYGVPMENWECRYCGFKDIHCPGIDYK